MSFDLAKVILVFTLLGFAFVYDTLYLSKFVIVDGKYIELIPIEIDNGFTPVGNLYVPYTLTRHLQCE